MSLLGSIKKLWKAKNRLRDKITPFTKQINKKLGLTDSYYDHQPTYDYNVDENNIVRLGSASFNSSGHRVIADPMPGLHTLDPQQPQHVLQDTTNAMAVAPRAVGPLVNSNPYTAPAAPIGAAPIATPMAAPVRPGLGTATYNPLLPQGSALGGVSQFGASGVGRAPPPRIPSIATTPMAPTPASPGLGPRVPTPRQPGLSTIRSGMNTYGR